MTARMLHHLVVGKDPAMGWLLVAVVLLIAAGSLGLLGGARGVE